MKQNKHLRKIFWCVLSVFTVFIITLFTCHFIVFGNASGRTYEEVDSIPHNRYGLLLATSPITPSGAHNFYFDNRIKAADELYKAGKIDFIIASGGDYTKEHKNGCDEPAAIRDSLVVRGIPADRIILDYEGLRTLNSIVKAKGIYGLDSVTLISQKYHNERAIYLADHYNIHAVGYNAAPSHIRRNRIKNTLREYLARPKMFIDLAFGWNPNINLDTIVLPNEYCNELDIVYSNSVKGHIEVDSIVGNFTGLGIDTIYIADTPLSKTEKKRLGFRLVVGDDVEDYQISYAVSNNPDIPPVELFWPSGLVFEGDVDGDGKDEWGYLYQWITSQWRQYRIYNYDSKTKTWRHLYYGDLLDTPEYVRSSGVDIVEKGPHSGFIKINYGTWGAECELRDTIVKPTYTPISEDAW